MGGARVTTLVTLRKCTLGNKREIKTLKFVSASTKGFKGGLAWIKPSKKDMAVTFSYYLDLVRELLHQHHLFSCIDKSTCFKSRVPFCGYIIDRDGVHMDPEKIKVIQGWRPPTTVHEVRQFIVLCGFYQQFVEGFQGVAAPLTAVNTAMFKANIEWE